MSAGSARAARAAIGGVCLLAVLTLTYTRLFFGIDFTDESFYIAVPLRFVMGARPLIDETNVVQQTPGIILYPFVKVYVALFGLDGIVLFARHLHLLFSAVIAAAIFVGLRPVSRTLSSGHCLPVLLSPSFRSGFTASATTHSAVASSPRGCSSGSPGCSTGVAVTSSRRALRAVSPCSPTLPWRFQSCAPSSPSTSARARAQCGGSAVAS